MRGTARPFAESPGAAAYDRPQARKSRWRHAAFTLFVAALLVVLHPRPSRHREQNRRHRAERQPESRRHHGPRIDQQHEAQRPRQHHRSREVAPADKGERHHPRHPQRALGRHVETRQGCMQPGEQRATHHRDNLRGQQQRPVAADESRAPPHCPGEPRREAGGKADVQTRDRHQMTGARAAHQQPVGRADFVLRADGERHHDPAMRRVGEHAVNARTQRGAPAIDRHAYATRHAMQAHSLSRRAHIAGGAHIARQQTGFHIAHAEVRIAMRAFEPHRQTPARARASPTPRPESQRTQGKAAHTTHANPAMPPAAAAQSPPTQTRTTMPASALRAIRSAFA
ncbi:hypothetical protein KCU90_g1132, partial [Aureobasidium melanogenum]